MSRRFASTPRVSIAVSALFLPSPLKKLQERTPPLSLLVCETVMLSSLLSSATSNSTRVSTCTVAHTHDPGRAAPPSAFTFPPHPHTNVKPIGLLLLFGKNERMCAVGQLAAARVLLHGAAKPLCLRPFAGAVRSLSSVFSSQPVPRQ